VTEGFKLNVSLSLACPEPVEGKTDGKHFRILEHYIVTLRLNSVWH